MKSQSPIYLVCLFVDNQTPPYTCCTKTSKILGFVRESQIQTKRSKQNVLDKYYAELAGWSDPTTNPVVAFVKQGSFIY